MAKFIMVAESIFNRTRAAKGRVPIRDELRVAVEEVTADNSFKFGHELQSVTKMTTFVKDFV